MTVDQLNKLMRLVVLIANRNEVYRKLAMRHEFAEAVMLVAPMINAMSDEDMAKLRKELL
jgi:hypothetical protein